MKIDATQVITTLAGKPFKDQAEAGTEPKDLTVGIVVSNILSTVKSRDPMKSHVLALKFYQEEEVEVPADDIVFIKAQITTAVDQPNGTFIPFILGQVLTALDAT